MEVSGFLSGSRKFLTGDVFELAAQVEAGGGGLNERLGALSNEIDEFLKSGSRSMSEIDERAEFIRNIQRNVGNQSVGDIADVPTHLRREKGRGVDPIEDAISRIRGEGGIPFDASLDEALHGKALINKSNIDEVISGLRDSSSYWSSGLISSQSQRIEAFLKGPKPVSADAAVLLGQPLATAKVPMSINKKGEVTYSSVHLVTDGIIGGPAGFESLDDMRIAAEEYIGQNPGKTLIGITDSKQGYHLLSTTGETGPRTLSQPGKFARRDSSREVPVTFEANHPKVTLIVGSDRKSVYSNRSDLADDQATFAASQWPDGYSPPMSVEALSDLGGVETRKSVSWVLDDELLVADADKSKVDARIEDLVALRTRVRDKRIEAGEIGQVIDRAGRGTPAEWELEDLITHQIFGSATRGEFVREFGGLAKALPGYSVADAVHHATSVNLSNPKLVTVVMQDSAGTPHLLAIRNPSGFSWNRLDIHPDLRAIVMNNSGVIALRRNQIGSAKDVLQEVGVKGGHQDLHDLFNANFAGNRVSNDTDWLAKFEPYSAAEPIRMLDIDDHRRAATIVASEMSSMSNKDATVLLVEAPVGKDGKKALGLVRVQDASGGWTPYPDYDWATNATSNVLAAIDKDGVQFLRQ